MTIQALTGMLAVMCGLACASAQPAARADRPAVRYDGHRIVEVWLNGVEDVRAMEALGAAVWACEPGPGWCEFRVPAGSMAALEATGIAFRVVVADLQKRVDAENARLRGAGGGGVAGAGWFDDYKSFTQIYSYCVDLSVQFPALAEFIIIGNSLEGRPIFGLRIKGDAQGHCVPTLLLNSCQHAREWITPMVTVYAADQLLRQYGIDPAITALVDSSEVIVIPVANPDGYDYTWSVDRFWRKNRRDNGGGSFGVDNNRNWGYQWGSDNGSSGDPESQVYRGAAPFSEPENRALRDWCIAHPALRAHNDIHSFGQYILEPWGFTPDPTPDADVFLALGQSMRGIIKAVHGHTYKAGPLYTTLYPVSGGALDWFYGDRGGLSISYELRGPGFDPPPDQILPCAEETFPATLYHIQSTISAYPFLADWTRDGVYDLFDFLAFTNDFNAGSPRADLYGDGVLDLFDFLVFLDAFAVGQ